MIKAFIAADDEQRAKGLCTNFQKMREKIIFCNEHFCLSVPKLVQRTTFPEQAQNPLIFSGADSASSVPRKTAQLVQNSKNTPE